MRAINARDLINDLHLLDLSVRELTIVKATVLQEMALQIGEPVVVRGAVRAESGPCGR